MKLILIAALNKNRVIGRDGKIPWHIPEDLQRFKRITSNHTILMGRKTFESIGKPLPNRRNVIISRNKNHVAESMEVFPTVASALSALENEEKVFVIGGGEIFLQTIDRADELNLTIVENDESGDVFFPPYEQLLGKLFYISSEENHEMMKYLTVQRNNGI
jgi:dihydrofolate reductase